VAAKIRYDDLERVSRFTARLVLNLDALDRRPEWVKVERAPSQTGDRDTVRAYTGTIPDYATEVAGLRLSGVIGGGPADRAGLREGDVIVELGGRSITNIYDYTFALDAVKIDEAIRVVFMRDGKRLEAEITPTSRP
jgi:S1-C subfamily serine protease